MANVCGSRRLDLIMIMMMMMMMMMMMFVMHQTIPALSIPPGNHGALAHAVSPRYRALVYSRAQLQMSDIQPSQNQYFNVRH